MQAERRLIAEQAVARILVESSSLSNAAPRILQAISQSLRWEVGTFWTLDGDADLLRCMEVWHASTVNIAALEQVRRQRTFSKGIGLPGAVWAGDSPIWIPDLTQYANFSPALIAAKEGLHAAVGFPIRNGSELLGVMEFFSLEIRHGQLYRSDRTVDNPRTRSGHAPAGRVLATIRRGRARLSPAAAHAGADLCL